MVKEQETKTVYNVDVDKLTIDDLCLLDDLKNGDDVSLRDVVKLINRVSGEEFGSKPAAELKVVIEQIVEELQKQTNPKN